MRPSQRALAQEIVDFDAGIAVLGMGGGKTCLFLTAVDELRKLREIDQALVLAPPNVVTNAWPHEPGKWEHLQHMDVVPVVGTPAKRKKLLQEEHDVYVVSIDNVQWLINYFRNSPVWERRSPRTLLGIDEISKFKGARSKRAQKLRNYAERFAGVWGLTGTPRPNDIQELFNPIKIVGGLDAWGIRDYDLWLRENFKPLDYQGYKWEVHDFARPSLERIAREWLVYAPTDDLGKPKLNTGDDFIKYVHLTPEQRGHYDRFEEEMFTEVDRMVEEGWDRELAVIQAMSQGAVSVKLTQIVQGFLYDEKREAIPLKENPKLDQLMEMDQALGGDHAVIAYGFRYELHQLKAALKHRSVGVLGGEVTPAQARKTIAAFSNGEIERLLLHPASAGHGVDGLQLGGNHVIWYHPTWSPELEEQTIQRIDRPGQTRETFNWRIQARDTVDDIKLARTSSKIAEQEAFKKTLRRVI